MPGKGFLCPINFAAQDRWGFPVLCLSVPNFSSFSPVRLGGRGSVSYSHLCSHCPLLLHSYAAASFNFHECVFQGRDADGFIQVLVDFVGKQNFCRILVFSAGPTKSKRAERDEMGTSWPRGVLTDSWVQEHRQEGDKLLAAHRSRSVSCCPVWQVKIF